MTRDDTGTKTALRAKLRKRIKQLPQRERSAQSLAIRSRLHFPSGAQVALFAGTESEVQLLPLLGCSKNITWYLPRTLEKNHMEFLPVRTFTQLTKNHLGIKEPRDGVPAKTLDYIVCPGLAFTPLGVRLGQGGGFYDRALLSYPSAQFIGVCFQCQLLSEIPTEKHDLKMDRIITAQQEFGEQAVKLSP